MSKYNISRIAFVLALLGCWLLQNYVLALVLIIVFIALLSAGAFFIRWNFYHTTINQIENSNEVFLTFDDGPHPNYTPLILDILQRHQCRATFFCIGHKIKGNEDLLHRMVAEGHVVGVHTWFHSYWFDLFPTYKMKQEIINTQNEIERVTGFYPLLFRPPYGVTNPMLARAMKSIGVMSIGWNIRSLDTVVKSSKNIVSKISRHLRPQSIVLLHDTQPHGVEILKELIQACSEKNLRVGDVQKYLNCYRMQ